MKQCVMGEVPGRANHSLNSQVKKKTRDRKPLGISSSLKLEQLGDLLKASSPP